MVNPGTETTVNYIDVIGSFWKKQERCVEKYVQVLHQYNNITEPNTGICTSLDVYLLGIRIVVQVHDHQSKTQRYISNSLKLNP